MYNVVEHALTEIFRACRDRIFEETQQLLSYGQKR